MNKLPKAKTGNIVVQDLQDELLVYDLTTHQAYTLNETSKIVYQSCDENKTFDELKRKYKFTDDLIHLALNELKTHSLLEDYESDHFAGLSRREIIRRVGLATAAALPVIAGLVAPRSAEAVSLAANGQPCEINSNCASTCCGANALGAANQFCVAVGRDSTGTFCRVGCECQSLCCVNNVCEAGNLGAGSGCITSCQCASKSCNTITNTCNQPEV